MHLPKMEVEREKQENWEFGSRSAAARFFA